METKMIVKEVEQKVSSIVAGATEIQVIDQASFQGAALYLKTVKGAIKFVDEKFAGSVKAAKKSWDEIRGLRDEAKEPLTKSEGILKTKMAEWSVAEEVKRKVEEEKMQAAADMVAEEDGVPAMAVVVPSAVPDVAGVHTRKSWKFEILDVAKVKDTYKIADEKKIRKIVTAMGLEAVDMVGGIRVWQESSIVARGE